MEIPLEQIRPSPYQPRLTFDLEDIKGSIMRDGLLVSLTVRKKNGYYELVDGERRWRLAKELGYKTVPCDVIDIDDDTARRMVWKVNTLRKDYAPKEKALFFKKMQKKFGMSLRGMAREYDTAPNTVLAYLNVFKLPEEYQKLVWAREIPIRTIQALESLFNGVIRITLEENPEVIEMLDRSAKEKHFGAEEIREAIKPYLAKVREEQIKKTKEVLAKIEPKVKAPETTEELEEAAKALMRRAEELKTPEQRAEEKRRKLIIQARKSFNSVAKKIDGVKKIIDVGVFRERLNELEKSLEQNPAEVRERLIALGKEVTETQKRRQREIEEEKRHKEEEERKRRLEEERRRVREAEKRRLEEGAKRRAEEELKEALEAERRRMEEEAEEKWLGDREYLEKAEERLKEIRLRELKTRRLEELMVKRPQINVLNELSGKEWLEFTKSWHIFDALESDLAEERAVTSSLTEEHPATFSPTMISNYVRFFTKRDAVVLDPFVGIGSTLVACSRAGRRGIGIDINEQYVEIARKRVEEDSKQTVILGDSWDIEKYDLPKIDYCVTSPPYFRMLEKIDVTQRRRMRFKGLATDYGESVVLPEEVDEYIGKLVDLFSKIAKLTKENGYLTVILQNFRDKERMVPLAWQFAIAMQERGDWVFKGERIWCQDHKKLHPFGQKFDFVSNIHHHYCLIFRKRSNPD